MAFRKVDKFHKEQKMFKSWLLLIKNTDTIRQYTTTSDKNTFNVMQQTIYVVHF